MHRKIDLSILTFRFSRRDDITARPVDVSFVSTAVTHLEILLQSSLAQTIFGASDLGRESGVDFSPIHIFMYLYQSAMVPPRYQYSLNSVIHFSRLARSRRIFRRCPSWLLPSFTKNIACSFSTSTDDSSTNNAFHRSLKRQQRDNAARRPQGGDYDYIRTEIATRLVDRLDDMRRAFPLALDLGAGPGYIHRAICADDSLTPYDDDGPVGGIGGVRKLVQLDASSGMLQRDVDGGITVEGDHRCDTYRLAVEDEEDDLPFPDGTFDLVISSCSLHWMNKLPHVFSEIHRVLKPDGCFLMAMVGGSETLPELRAAMVLAEMEREGGVSPHVGPFVQVTDVGMLLQQAGFTLPTVDVDTHKILYPNAAVLMEHLQRMGENNAALQRRPRVARDTFLATACLYDHMFQAESSSEREVEASLQVIYAIGWTPHESQPEPNERGTATHKVGEIVEVTKTQKPA